MCICFDQVVRFLLLKVVYLSSDYVFNGHNGPYSALDTKDLEPLNVYGRSKLEGERQLAATVEKILAGARCVAAMMHILRQAPIIFYCLLES